MHIIHNLEDIIKRITLSVKAFANISNGATFSSPLYLSNSADDVIATYNKLSYSNDSALVTGTTTVKNSDGEKIYDNYLFPNAIDTVQIPAGTWTFGISASLSAVVGITKFKATVFVRHIGGTETDLFSAYSNQITDPTANGIQLQSFTSTQPQYTVLTTDRLGIRLYVMSTHTVNITVSIGIGGATTSYFSTPLALSHTNLRNLNADTSNVHVTQAQKDVLAKYPAELIENGTSNLVSTISPNKMYTWGTLTSANTLSLTLGSTTSGVLNEFMFEFKTGASVPVFSAISGVTWVGSNPTLAINKTYQFSIVNGIGAWAYA